MNWNPRRNISNGRCRVVFFSVMMKAESPARLTLFAGYANGMIGYLPTAEEHARGGYEVDVSPYFYRLSGRLDPDAGAQAAEQSRELIGRLFASN